MIYLDNAATSFPKPRESTEAMCIAARSCAGYGRSGHAAALRAGEIVFDCRSEIAEMFRAPSPNHVVFTLNATMALNYAIHALVPAGSTVCVSGYEHNSVIRPLTERNCIIDIAAPCSGKKMIDVWEAHLQKRPACAVVNHASNVFGYLQPIEAIGRLCSWYGVPLIVDASQSAGICEIDISQIPNCAALCMAGHKGLWGPQGTGIMIATDLLPKCALITGGTGSRSILQRQPKEMLDLFESGTLNLPGIAGLLESVRLVRKIGVERIAAREKNLCERLVGHLREITGLRLIERDITGARLAVVSVTAECAPCDLVGEWLAENGVFVRTGLHCAPIAHRTEGTLQTGTIRFSIGWLNTEQEIDSAAEILQSIVNTLSEK